MWNQFKAWWRRVTGRGGAPARPVQPELPADSMRGSMSQAQLEKHVPPECRRRAHYSRGIRGRRGKF